QGKIAWAVLGDRNARQLLPNKDTVWIRGLIETGSDEWYNPVRDFGGYVGQCFRTMPGKIEELSLVSSDRPEQARTDLTLADLLRREWAGAGGRQVGRAPPAEGRRLRWHDLLLQQADRTYRDHWAAERKGEPYYRQIGARYIDDAQSLIGDKPKPADKDPR